MKNKKQNHIVKPIVGADLAIDAFLNSISEHQHIKGLIQHPHHHGLRVQWARLLQKHVWWMQIQRFFSLRN